MQGPRKFHVRLGFGIDAYHGICHYSFLETTAERLRGGGYLGCVSGNAGTAEGDALLDAIDFLNERQPNDRSIVCNSVASAVRGAFGDHHATDLTEGSELFIYALMTLYWCYDLRALARLMGFYGAVAETRRVDEVDRKISRYHDAAERRDWKGLPL